MALLARSRSVIQPSVLGPLRSGNLHQKTSILRLFSSASSPSQPKGNPVKSPSSSGQKKQIWKSSSLAQDVPTVTDATLPELIWSGVRKWESSPAFECGMTGRKYTQGEVYRHSRSFGAALLKSGLKPKDVIAVMLPNVPEYAIALLGAMEAGLIVSPVNPTSTLYELENQLSNCRAKCVITIEAFVPVVTQIKNSSVTSTIVVGPSAPEGTHSFFQMLQTDPTGTEFLTASKVNVTEQTVLIPYSSGTTGPPKGVELTHSNIATNLLQHLSPTLTVKRRFDECGEQDRIVGILPFYHIFALNCVLLSTLYMGSHCLTLPKFDPVSFVKAFRVHKPTVAHLVTPILNFMIHSREFTTAELAHLRAIVAGAAPVGTHIVRAFMSKCSPEFFYQEGYGMTEMSPVSHLLPPCSKNTKIGSVGISAPSTCAKIIHMETGNALGPNEIGELCIKGPQVMKGYFENEAATKESFDEEGYLKTGDVGYFDEEGYLYIVDRLKELIKVKGLQVAPSELENLIREVPGVADCAVIGVPSASSGELPRAYVVKADGGPKVEAKDIGNYLSGKVSKYKQLAGGIEFIGAIPKAGSGKILRRELKKLYEETK